MNVLAQKCMPTILEMIKVAVGLFVVSTILGAMLFR